MSQPEAYYTEAQEAFIEDAWGLFKLAMAGLLWSLPIWFDLWRAHGN